jgi:hypothetical protein
MHLAPLGLVFMAASVLFGDHAGTATRTAPAHSEWAGTYECAQGLTNVRLTIETTPVGGAAVASFEFSANAANPRSVPSGAYLLRGMLAADADGALRLHLEPDRWLVHPRRYYMVGLTATGGRDQGALTGSIDNAACGAIAVHRVDR